MAIDVKVPGVGESVQEGMIASWAKANNDWIRQDEVLCELETDKATVEIVAENSGKLTILAEVGKVVKVGEVIARIDETVQGPDTTETKKVKTSTNETPPNKAPAVEAASKPSPPNLEPKKSPPSTLENGPAVRRMLAEKDVSLESVSASGKSGRLTKGDIVEAL